MAGRSDNDPRPDRIGHVLWVADHHPGEWVVWPRTNSGSGYSALKAAEARLPDGWVIERAVRNSRKVGSNGKTTVGDVYWRVVPPDVGARRMVQGAEASIDWQREGHEFN